MVKPNNHPPSDKVPGPERLGIEADYWIDMHQDAVEQCDAVRDCDCVACQIRRKGLAAVEVVCIAAGLATTGDTDMLNAIATAVADVYDQYQKKDNPEG